MFSYNKNPLSCWHENYAGIVKKHKARLKSAQMSDEEMEAHVYEKASSWVVEHIDSSMPYPRIPDEAVTIFSEQGFFIIPDSTSQDTYFSCLLSHFKLLLLESGRDDIFVYPAPESMVGHAKGWIFSQKSTHFPSGDCLYWLHCSPLGRTILWKMCGAFRLSSAPQSPISMLAYCEFTAKKCPRDGYSAYYLPANNLHYEPAGNDRKADKKSVLKIEAPDSSGFRGFILSYFQKADADAQDSITWRTFTADESASDNSNLKDRWHHPSSSDEESDEVVEDQAEEENDRTTTTKEVEEIIVFTPSEIVVDESDLDDDITIRNLQLSLSQTIAASKQSSRLRDGSILLEYIEFLDRLNLPVFQKYRYIDQAKRRQQLYIEEDDARLLFKYRYGEFTEWNLDTIVKAAGYWTDEETKSRQAYLVNQAIRAAYRSYHEIHRPAIKAAHRKQRIIMNTLGWITVSAAVILPWLALSYFVRF